MPGGSQFKINIINKERCKVVNFETMDKILTMADGVVAMVREELGVCMSVSVDTFYEHSNRGGYVVVDNADSKTVFLNMGCEALEGMSTRDILLSMAGVVAHEVRHIYQMEHNMFNFAASQAMAWESRPEEIDAEDYAWSWVDANIAYITNKYIYPGMDTDGDTYGWRTA
jgi:hypothetical protein